MTLFALGFLVGIYVYEERRKKKMFKKNLERIVVEYRIIKKDRIKE